MPRRMHAVHDDSPTLFDVAPLVAPPKEGSIEQQFMDFHRANPWVYTALVSLAREHRARRPDTRVGIGMLFEVLRWSYNRRTTGDEFKLNNNYRSRYSRLIAEREQDLADAFEMRRLTAA